MRFHTIYSGGNVNQVPFTAAEETARDAEELQAPALALAKAQSDAGDRIDNTTDILRALVLLLLDELNLHATTTDAILIAAANATNLTDLKTRMGQIAAIPQRTASQLRTALLNKLGS